MTTQKTLHHTQQKLQHWARYLAPNRLRKIQANLSKRILTQTAQQAA